MEICTLIGVLLLLLCSHSTALTKNEAMKVLEDVYTSATGPQWDFARIRKLNEQYYGEDHNKVWNFEKSGDKYVHEDEACQWIGVFCGDKTDVATINKLWLPGGNLKGTISDSIEALTSLTSLDFSASNLFGTIPESLSNLKMMQTMYLDTNQLTGTIPAFSGPLKIFVVNNNKLTGPIPKNSTDQK